MLILPSKFRAISTLRFVKQIKDKENSILWVEAIGFTLLIALCWVTELVRLPQFLFGEAFTPDWRRAVLRTVVLLLVWAWVHAATKRLLKRLHYLEDFLRICSWCRKVCYDGKWLMMEHYFDSKFATRTSHGMCPECMEKSVQELKQRKKTEEKARQALSNIRTNTNCIQHPPLKPELQCQSNPVPRFDK